MRTIDLIPFETFEAAEDKTNEFRRKSAEEEIKKRMIKKGKSYKLHNLIYNLQNLNKPNIVTDQDLGLVYSSLVLSLPKSSYLSDLNNPLQNNSLERSFKKRFQELTRVGLYRLYQHLHVGKHQFSGLSEIYQQKLLERVSVVNGKPGTIEGEISTLMSNEGFMDDSLFGIIGNALKEGTQDYFTQYRKAQSEPKFREYNSVLERIEKITK